MAERCLLHQSKLDLFKGIYEVLRAKKDKETVIVFRKAQVKEHLTVQQKDHRLVRQFIRETRTVQSDGVC